MEGGVDVKVGRYLRVIRAEQAVHSEQRVASGEASRGRAAVGGHGLDFHALCVRWEAREG